MQTPVRTTELKAVNVCLALMGSSPVSSLIPPYGVDVANSRNLIEEVSSSIQCEGWKFNQRSDYTLARNAQGKIPVASNIVSVDADTDSGVDVVFLNGFLYDLKANTDVFDHDVKCEVMFMFAFDQLPETLRRYIMISAARKFQTRYLGSENQEAFTQIDETRARVTWLNDEGRTADVNILNSPDQSYISRRNRPRRRQM